MIKVCIIQKAVIYLIYQKQITMSVKVKLIETGEVKIAVYTQTIQGNFRYNVDGKFYSDKKFNKCFEIIKQDEKKLG